MRVMTDVKDLNDSFDEELFPMFDDISLDSGVLNVVMRDGRQYVINKQRPNKQIWLSSPISGPGRFSYQQKSDSWIQVRSGVELKTLLEAEFNSEFR